MTFGEIPSDVELTIRKIVASDPQHRKYNNLVTEWKVRRKYDIRIISTSGERMMFLLLVWAEQNPDNPVSQAVIDAWYDSHESLKHMNLTSSDTILKDNREMERYGLFPKPEEDKPKVVQPVPIGQTTF